MKLINSSIEWLKENSHIHTIKQMMKELDTSRSIIKTQIKKYKLPYLREYEVYSDEELEILKESPEKHTMDALLLLLPRRNKPSIVMKLFKLKIVEKGHKFRGWNNKNINLDKEVLLKEILTNTTAVLAKKYDCYHGTIRNLLEKYGFDLHGHRYRELNDEDKKYIEENIHKKDYVDLANAININKGRIREYMAKNGLKFRSNKNKNKNISKPKRNQYERILEARGNGNITNNQACVIVACKTSQDMLQTLWEKYNLDALDEDLEPLYDISVFKEILVDLNKRLNRTTPNSKLMAPSPSSLVKVALYLGSNIKISRMYILLHTNTKNEVTVRNGINFLFSKKCEQIRRSNNSGKIIPILQEMYQKANNIDIQDLKSVGKDV